MDILFPADPLNRFKPDPDYVVEVAAALEAGFGFGLLDDGIHRDETPIIRRKAAGWKGDKVLYRGWMLTPQRYSRLAEAVPLVTSPLQYMRTHLLPEWYSLLQEHTPESLWWLPDSRQKTTEDPLGLTSILPIVAKVFGDAPIMVKDWVKSRKHEFADAFYIHTASDADEVRRVVSNFLERQGEQIVGDLVFRRFVPLRKIGQHPKSGIPLANEWRLFFWNQELFFCNSYWKEFWDKLEIHEAPDFQEAEKLAKKISSPLFTMDVAQTESGEWIVIELGDGGVSGLQGADPQAFYTALAKFT